MGQRDKGDDDDVKKAIEPVAAGLLPEMTSLFSESIQIACGLSYAQYVIGKNSVR